MRDHLHMPSYFLGTFTEYPFTGYFYIFRKDKKMHICLNDRVKQKIRKLSVTIQRSCNCVELLRFTTRRTTLCKCSEYPGNYKINNLNFVENADRIFLSVLFIVVVSFITKKLFTGGASRLLQIGVSTISVSYSSIFSTCVTNAGRISLSNSCRARAVTSLYTEE